jgi:CYTH domain-containing protein
MPARKFIVASSVARMIRREFPTSWVVEGYLNGGEGRSTHVQIEGGTAQLVLAEEVGGKLSVEETAVPRRHAEALLEVSVGRLDIDRAVLSVGGRPALLDRVSASGRSLDILTVFIDETGAAKSFYPPPWVGQEVTDSAFSNRAFATDGIPDRSETTISNTGLEALLDMLERAANPARETIHAVPEPEQRQQPQPAPTAASAAEQAPAKEDSTPAAPAPADGPARSKGLDAVLHATAEPQQPGFDPSLWARRRK